MENTNYLYRANFLWGLTELAKCASPSTIAREIDQVIKLGKDPIANIRYQVLLTLLKIYQATEDKTIEEKLKKVSEGLANDSDLETKRLARSLFTTKDLKTFTEKHVNGSC